MPMIEHLHGVLRAQLDALDHARDRLRYVLTMMRRADEGTRWVSDRRLERKLKLQACYLIRQAHKPPILAAWTYGEGKAARVGGWEGVFGGKLVPGVPVRVWVP